MFHTLQDSSNTGIFQGHNIVVLVFKSLYQSLSNLTGMVGITPVQLFGGIMVIVLFFLGWSLINGIRGKTSFSLSPEDTPAPETEARRQPA